MERLTLDEAIKHAKEVAKTNRAEATYNALISTINLRSGWKN